MMMVYDLVFDNDKERQYKVKNDTGVGYLTVDKADGSVAMKGQFSSMFDPEFIKELASGTLKFKVNPPKHFVYGVG